MRRLAFDQASVRRTDADGRLHIAVNNISKASVDPYYGREIPGFASLRLDPNRVYYLLRDPDELAKAASTFNNLPILAEHVPVSVDDPQKDIVIGSTGTDASFSAPFLRNSAVIWTREALDHIEKRTRYHWSCAYRYTPDMTPGTWRGLHYDGIMREIHGNHVALVETGRAGPEVIVGDSSIKGGLISMSRTALLLQGVMLGAFHAVAAAASPEIGFALDSVTAHNLQARKPAIAAAIVAAVNPHLAADAKTTEAAVLAIMGAMDAEMSAMKNDDDMPAEDVMPDDDDMTEAAVAMRAKMKAKAQPKDDDMTEAAVAMRAKMKAKDDKPAMDASAIRAETIAEMNAIRDAEAAVMPHIGKLSVAMDSAAAIYKLALDHAKVDTTDVPAVAYKAMVAMLPAPKGAPLALDSAATGDARADFAARYPNAAPLIRSF